VKNIVAYNDQAALAAIAAAREAGKLDGIKVATTNSGQDVAGQAIKQGRMQSGYYVPWAELGKLMARAAYNAATKQATNMPNAVVPKSNLVTKANVDQFSFFH
jgi:ABC-type sugar transport system substrate-binding protein